MAYSISVRRFVEWKEARARKEERSKAPASGTFEGWMSRPDPGEAADAQFAVMLISKVIFRELSGFPN